VAKIKCTKCGSENTEPSGSILGKNWKVSKKGLQMYKCKDCNYEFSVRTKKEKGNVRA